MCLPNFDEISHSMAEIKLLPVSENGWPPFWNFISSFNFDVRIVIGMSFYISLSKFRSNRTIGGGVMTSYRFLKIAAIKSEIYFRDQV